MVVLKPSLVLPLLLLTHAQAIPQHQHIMDSSATDPANKVRDELKEAEIIPTVVDDFTPSLLLSVSWPDTDQKAKLGNTLKPEDLKDTPSISLKPIASSDQLNISSETSIVVVATDPDAPSRDDPKWSEFCHWIAVTRSSTPDAMVLSLDRDKLRDVISYKPPGPPEKTGKHRYVFLALVPANGTTEELHLAKPGERKHWGFGEAVNGVRKWAGENGLIVVGANFIYAQNKKQ
ncbi:phosphatidylethanolamine-binding protein [Cladorrhinum samala]|uniref:Phosphatidylethanolamine-binding protein n=1 Tax=Cladorrhinum samala TaxID=585594 RepID=A0AAV9HDG6_9PEZI|nr:phosphatidylethanolamine-binding protein [Cladorrhinum samala]